MNAVTTLSPLILDYLNTQRLGRLATVDPAGAPQNNPVGFTWNADLGTIDIGGYNMGTSRKFRNLATNPKVAFVVDDIASLNPWQVRCVEIRGVAEQAWRHDGHANMDPGIIRIHPTKIISFGLE